MIEQQPQIPPVDPGNPLLAEQPALFSTNPMQTPYGNRVALTLRVGNGTLTAILTRDDALAWAAQLESTASGITPLLIARPGAMPPPPPPGH